MKEKTDTIVFIYSGKDAIRFREKNSIENTLFVLCDMSESEFLKEQGFNFINFEKFTNDKTFENYAGMIWKFADNLFRDFSEYVSYKGLNLGELISYECRILFSEILFYFKQIEPIIRNYQPKKVFVFENIYLDKSSYYKYFQTDPIYEVLLYLKTKKEFALKLLPKSSNLRLKKKLMDKGFKILQIIQKIIYKINPYASGGDKIILTGAIKNLKPFINSSPESGKFKFHALLKQPALEYNLSKSFFFLNICPIFESSKNKDYFLEKYNQIIKNENFRKKFNFYGENLFELFNPRLKKIFINLFPLMCYYCDYLEYLLNKINPKAVYAVSDLSSLAKTLIKTANKKNIPTFVSQYGLNSFDFPITYWPSNAKYKLVWGETDKKMFMNFGVKKENIFVVGDLKFQDYESNISMNRLTLLKTLGINPNKKIILFISPYDSFIKRRSYVPENYITQEKNKKFLEIIFKTFSKKPDFHIIISPRPKSNENSFIEPLLKKYNMKNITIIDSRKFKPNDRLNACDAVITIRSTMGMEAMLLKKILLVYKMPPKEDQVEFLKYNAGYGFRTEQELTKLLDNLDKIKTKKYLKNQNRYLKQRMDMNKKINSFEKMIEIMKKHKS